MPRFSFEDFTPGWSRTLGPIELSKEAIVTFAREYDPQPFHTDEAAAKNSFVGRLIASGWHTCSLNMRLIADGFLLDTASMGAPGIDEVKWTQPVLPGDHLRSRATVLESRASRSRPDLGLVRFGFEVLNQRDEVVLTQSNWILIGRRDAAPAPESPAPEEARATRSGGEGPAAQDAPMDGSGRGAALPYLDDLVPGDRQDLGSYTFAAEDIIRFARQFDPQRFHVDPEAARASLLGGLCASGWHTASIWMRLLIAHRDRRLVEAAARGERPAQIGPSPGFKNLKWSKPVYAGDTITYSHTVVGARPSASRPGWGLAFHRNSGVNQHGEEVFSFDGTVFWERSP